MNITFFKTRSMKFIKPIYLILLKKMLVSFRFYFLFLVFMSLGVAATFDVKRMPDPSTTPLFQLYYEFLSVKIMVYMIFPFFLILNGIISDLFDRSNVLLQYNHQGTWWKDKVFSVVLFSIVFSLVINTAILVAIILSGNLMKIGIHFISYMLLGTVMQLVGFLMVGMVYHLFVLKWEKKILRLLCNDSYIRVV